MLPLTTLFALEVDVRIDLGYFMTATGDNQEVLRELGNIFLQQVREMNLEMEECVHEKNWEKLSKVAHKAKYSAAVIGLSDLSDGLKQMEYDAREKKHTDEFSARVASFRQSFEDASTELKKLIPGIKL
jgi:HPt (histidine-containing phosphotransfer) domain-containing protein